MEIQLQRMMRASDKLDIAETIGRYAAFFDVGDMESFYQLFTHDCLWELRVPSRKDPVASFKKQDGLRKGFDHAISRLGEPIPGLSTLHIQSGTVFQDLTPLEAETRTQLLILSQRWNDDGSEIDASNWHMGRLETDIPFGGIYHDKFRKVEDKWLFSERVFIAGAS